MADPTFDAAAVAAWLRLTDARDTGPLELIVPAVASFVDSLPDAPRLEATDGTRPWAPSTHLAALMLAARLYRRRNSPSGVEAFSEAGGAAYVSRYDSDVARLLRIDAFLRPQVG